MPIMECVGGEKDGYELKISASDRPDVFFATPNLDEEKIRNTKGNDAKRELRDRLAVLAYQFDPAVSTEERFRMRRCPELDKISH